MPDENTFTATDQLERELIWDALVDYKSNSADPDTCAAVQIMIDRVQSTFEWMRS